MIEEVEGLGPELQVDTAQLKRVFFTSDTFTF